MDDRWCARCDGRQIPEEPEAVNGMASLLDCSINGGTLYRQLTSKWFISHLIGWFVHTLIFRDMKYAATGQVVVTG